MRLGCTSAQRRRSALDDAVDRAAETRSALSDADPYVGRMSTSTGTPSQEQIEAAIQQTLVGWCAELDTGRKFWWGGWNRMIRDVITALRTGEPVL